MFIVDDSVMVCKRLAVMLTKFADIEVVGEAHDVPEAIKSIEKAKPDVVILDIKMPGGSGIDVVERVKKNATVPSIIMFTNYSHPFYRMKYLAAGADFFLDKSTEFEKISSLLKQLLEDSRN